MSARSTLASANAGGARKSPATVLIRIGPTPVAESAAMRDVLAAAEDVAGANTTVLVLGESGTGKEILARYIHRCSPRAQGPWVAVNCAALPSELLEAELFGHERGAFTGATERRIGRIEQADGGTLLLDEVSELPLALQAKLLRVLQEREVDRVGGTRAIPVDVRVIATSNRPLGEMVAARAFRADLFYRLNVFPIVLPPLRERLEDLPALADDLLRGLSQSLGRQAPTLGAEAMRALGQYDFPGNVRELANILERALVRCREPILDLEHLARAVGAREAAPGEPAREHGAHDDLAEPAPSPATDDDARASEVALPGDPPFPVGLPIELATLERLAIGEALRVEAGNRTHAARRLGISLRTLRNKLRAYRMASPSAASADGQDVPGTNDRFVADDRSTTLARASQSPGSRRAA